MATNRFGVSEDELFGPARSSKLTAARCWITQRAIRAELGSISWVAERMERSPSARARIVNWGADEE